MRTRRGGWRGCSRGCRRRSGRRWRGRLRRKGARSERPPACRGLRVLPSARAWGSGYRPGSSMPPRPRHGFAWTGPINHGCELARRVSIAAYGMPESLRASRCWGQPRRDFRKDATRGCCRQTKVSSNQALHARAVRPGGLAARFVWRWASARVSRGSIPGRRRWRGRWRRKGATSERGSSLRGGGRGHAPASRRVRGVGAADTDNVRGRLIAPRGPRTPVKSPGVTPVKSRGVTPVKLTPRTPGDLTPIIDPVDKRKMPDLAYPSVIV